LSDRVIEEEYFVDFGRLITAMVTPFNEHLEIDWDQTKRIIDYLIEEQKNDAIVVSGTTGESPTLTDDEKLKLFEFSVKHVNGRCKVIAGTGSNETAHSIHLTKAAEKTGVDGVLLVSPYYNKPSMEGVYQHFKAIAEATTLPIMVYNIPGRTGIQFTVDVTKRLAQIPNIVASKESHSDFDYLTRIINETPEDFRIYSGDDALTIPMMSIGAYGIVSVASHIVGSSMKEMIYTYLRGDVAGAIKQHAELFPIFHGLFNCPHKVPSPAPVKHALKLKGYDVGGLRLPLVAVTEEEARYIEALLK
jgi:4-hydroxy-tetrahydrodipicolinate synthase